MSELEKQSGVESGEVQQLNTGVVSQHEALVAGVVGDILSLGKISKDQLASYFENFLIDDSVKKQLLEKLSDNRFLHSLSSFESLQSFLSITDMSAFAGFISQVDVSRIASVGILLNKIHPQKLNACMELNIARNLAYYCNNTKIHNFTFFLHNHDISKIRGILTQVDREKMKDLFNNGNAYNIKTLVDNMSDEAFVNYINSTDFNLLFDEIHEKGTAYVIQKYSLLQ